MASEDNTAAAVHRAKDNAAAAIVGVATLPNAAHMLLQAGPTPTAADPCTSFYSATRAVLLSQCLGLLILLPAGTPVAMAPLTTVQKSAIFATQLPVALDVPDAEAVTE